MRFQVHGKERQMRFLYGLKDKRTSEQKAADKRRHQVNKVTIYGIFGFLAAMYILGIIIHAAFIFAGYKG